MIEPRDLCTLHQLYLCLISSLNSSPDFITLFFFVLFYSCRLRRFTLFYLTSSLFSWYLYHMPFLPPGLLWSEVLTSWQRDWGHSSATLVLSPCGLLTLFEPLAWALIIPQFFKTCLVPLHCSRKNCVSFFLSLKCTAICCVFLCKRWCPYLLITLSFPIWPLQVDCLI